MSSCCSKGTVVMGRCRCCELLNNDTAKKEVKYCRVCKVSLCESCRKDPIRRIKAFGKQFFT